MSEPTVLKVTDPITVDQMVETFYEPLEAEVHRQLTYCYCGSKATVYTNAEFLKHTGFGPKLKKDFAEYGAYMVTAKCDDCGYCEPVWINADIIRNVPQIDEKLFDWIAREQMELGCTHMMQHTVISTPYTGSFVYWYGERHIVCLECGAELILDPDIRRGTRTIIHTARIW